jgi:DNA-binding LacI/PurR family transcriptional regulator
MGKKKKRPTVGLQITNLIQEYPKPIFKGVVDMAEELDVNLVIYRGESPNTPYGYGYQCNLVYDLIRPGYLDALIIASGTICNYISMEEFNEYVLKFKPIPLISISIPIPGIPSILIDNTNGILEAVEHLVAHHKRKRIAFIKGPETNTEAVVRYRTFVEAMTNHDITVDESLVYSGNWTEWSGPEKTPSSSFWTTGKPLSTASLSRTTKWRSAP